MKQAQAIRMVLLCFMLSICSYELVLAGETDSTSFVKNLNAPSLGVTSSTVLFTWDDIFDEDLADDNYVVNGRSYDIYQDHVKISQTNKHVYLATGLLPGHTYTFSVCSSTDVQQRYLSENSITVSTREAGKSIVLKPENADPTGSASGSDAIQRAIDKCSKGGTVVVPPGTYYTTPFELKSDMTLDIQKGAMIVLSGFKEIGKPRMGSLITGRNLRNVVIMGEGVIDANGETWWPHFPPGTDVVNGVYRPGTLEFISCSRILIQGVTIQDPPMFNNVLRQSDSVIYCGVKLLKYSEVPGRNGDALDPYSSTNVLIVDCLFGNQDDCIAIKGSEKEDRFSENIIIRDCRFDGDAAPGSAPLGFAIGSGAKVRHVRVSNCVFKDAASLANIKTNIEKNYTFVEDVVIENISYSNTKHKDQIWNRAPISVDQFYYAPQGSSPSVREPPTPQTPVFRNITFRNITIDNPVGRGIYLAGFAGLPIKHVRFFNVRVRSKDGVTIQNVDDISFESFKVLPASSNTLLRR